jgi:hypothetical protein
VVLAEDPEAAGGALDAFAAYQATGGDDDLYVN